ncbi:MAG: BMP family protein [Fimbriimonadaceae bacterium]|nr:BMP family protein [Fimbriimonadaceae bacterium]
MKVWSSLAALSLLLVVGCSGGSKEPDQTSTGGDAAKGEAEFKVALLTPGPVSDQGWSALAYDGLKAIEGEMSARVDNQQATGPQIKDSMRSYARQGYKLVFGHGYEYNEPAAEIAKEFPNTIFISSSGGMTAENVGAFRFYLEQSFYLCGYMAGMMTKTGKVAMVGLNYPSIVSTFKGFKAGAEAARPGIVVIEKFIQGGTDIAEAKLSTLTAISQGADFVIHQANAAAPGIFGACKEKNVYCFGANWNQNEDGPTVIASATIIARPAFLELAKEVKEGKYKGSVVLKDMQQGAIDFILNPKLADKVPAEVKAKLDELKKQITDGTLVVPKDEF